MPAGTMYEPDGPPLARSATAPAAAGEPEEDEGEDEDGEEGAGDVQPASTAQAVRPALATAIKGRCRR
jgi:hypothetical protein